MLLVSNARQVGGREGGKGVLIEGEGSVDDCQGGNADGRGVAESGIAGPDEVR